MAPLPAIAKPKLVLTAALRLRPQPTATASGFSLASSQASAQTPPLAPQANPAPVALAPTRPPQPSEIARHDPFRAPCKLTVRAAVEFPDVRAPAPLASCSKWRQRSVPLTCHQTAPRPWPFHRARRRKKTDRSARRVLHHAPARATYMPQCRLPSPYSSGPPKSHSFQSS